MASTSLLTAVIERLMEKTKEKHPGKDILKKKPKPRAPSKRKKGLN